ncbi:MAG: cysteine hydrolase [Acidobacteriota bacterium]|nr:cysteine hydrolase [Acidobacteriota bacterium]
MEKPLDASAALLLIDVQQAFDDPRWGPRNNPQAEPRIAQLLAAFRRAGRPVCHVKHTSAEPGSTLGPGSPGNAFKPEARPLPGEALFEKSVNSAFIGTELENHLHREGIGTLVIVGFTTNHCVSTTARMAANLGFHAVVVDDACATFDFKDEDGAIPAATMHRVGLAELRGEFAEILETSEVLRRLET